MDVTAELFSAIDDGELNELTVQGFAGRGADLSQGLSHALAGGKLKAVFVLAPECALVMGGEKAPPTAQEVLSMASGGEWGSAAYFVASSSEEYLQDRLRAPDISARQRLEHAAGAVRVRLPHDLRSKYIQSGVMAPELHVERKRWMLPRPRPEESFRLVNASNKNLSDGWYSVVQYPVADDCQDAILRRKVWTEDCRTEAARVLREEGETLMCKAVKDSQWEFVDWLVRRGDAAALAEQLQFEFADIWEGMERRSVVQTHEELYELCACLPNSGGPPENSNRLIRPWRRGHLEVPYGAMVKSPRPEILKDALKLQEPLSMEALYRVSECVVVFIVPCPKDVRRRWLIDLVAVREPTYAWPLLHRAVVSRQDDLLVYLLQAMVNADAVDARGITAVAVAATSGQWRAVDTLLDQGCRADGCSGMLAIAAAERASKPGAAARGVGFEECTAAQVVHEKLVARQLRAPTRSLAEYFQRQAEGEVVQGIEPRRFEISDDMLRPKGGGGPRVWARAMVLDKNAKTHIVRFLALDAGAYTSAIGAEALNVKNMPLVHESRLPPDAIAVAVAVPPERLATERNGTTQVLPSGKGSLLESLPIVARAPPTGKLRVQSTCSCCREAVGRVEVFMSKIRMGETCDPKQDEFGTEISAVEILVPLRPLEVSLEMSGHKLKEQHLEVPEHGRDFDEIAVEVPVNVFIYVSPVDETLDFIFVCGHRRDLPEDATPFIGEASWDLGKKALSGFEPLMMGGDDCLARLQSLRLNPAAQLVPPGRRFEAVEWVDTSVDGIKACQYKRVLVNPVRVGKISA